MIKRKPKTGPGAPDAESAQDPAARKRADILKSRADELAVELAGQEDTGNVIEVLEFVLASEHYGIETNLIGEVYPMREYTPIPGTPDFVMGLINIRGRIVSVNDIRRFFDLPVKGLSDLNRVIVVQTSRMELGILADRIVGVRTVRADALQTSLPTLTGIRAEYLRGIALDGLVVLDVEKMVMDTKLVVNDEVE
ncbi:MAG: chemotaxis protein CheW [bacterium]|nr:chemotaxis protein CheW [bacterium]